MKIQKLTIHNIASIEDAEIDFESSPLSDSELFLITGKTGSGKSTILDAICLALYASTPRLANTKMQGSTKDKGQTVAVTDPRQLLRRNKGEGFVRLAFIGTDKIPYEAEWAVRRARDKAEGKLQSKTWTLKDLSTGKTYTKEVEIKTAMAGAIGLTFEQFCRTTLLAQGEFTRFLNSDDKDKAAILEKITGVNVYSEIGAAIFRITSEKLSKLNEAKLRADAINIPSDEDIKVLEDSLAQAKLQQNILDSQNNLLEDKISWLKQLTDLTLRIDEAEKAVAEAKVAIDSDEYRKDSAIVADWTISAAARDSYLAKNHAQNEKVRLEGLQNDNKSGYLSFLGACAYEKEQLQALKDTLDTLSVELEKSAQCKDLYLNEQTVSAHLKTLVDTFANIAEQNQQLEQLSQRKQEAELQQEHKRVLYEAAEKAFVDADAEISREESRLQEYGLLSYRQSADAISRKINLLTSASGAINAHALAISAYESTVGQIEKLKVRILEKQVEQETFADQMTKAQIAKDVAFDICEKQKAGVEDWAKAVRATLSIDDECPVCRHKIESLPAEEEMDRVYRIAYEAYMNAKQAYDDIQSNYNKAVAEQNAFAGQLDDLKVTLEEQSDVVDLKRTALNESLNKCDLEFVDGIADVVAVLLSESEASLEALKEKIEVGETMERSISLKRSQRSNLIEARDTARNNASDAADAVRSIMHGISTAQALVAQQCTIKEQTVSVLDNLIGNADPIGIDWMKNPDDYRKRLKHLASQYLKLQEDVATLNQSVQTLQSRYDDLTRAVELITDEMPDWIDLNPSINEAMEKPLDKANDILADIKSCKKMIGDMVAKIVEANRVIDGFIGSHASVGLERLAELSQIPVKEITLLNDGLEQRRTAVATAESALVQHNKLMKSLMERKPLYDEGETQDTLEEALNSCKDELRKLSESKGAIEEKLQQIADAKKRFGHFQDQINICRVEWEKWDRLNSHLGDATGAKFRKIAQSYVLANLIRAANVYMKTLSDRYTLAVEPGEFVIMVEDSTQGYVHRAVSTISGGESFLVSLSLALALSDIGHMLAVDILFIDEGFGTLSGDPLMKAIGTLKSLHLKSGRKVGIISHVEELKEKVPVLIQVHQDANSSKSTIKII